MINNKLKKKIWEGEVIKISGEKTIKVAVSYLIVLPKIEKRLIRKSILLVHDPESKCKVGEKVQFVSCAPISKLKSFVLIKKK